MNQQLNKLKIMNQIIAKETKFDHVFFQRKKTISQQQQYKACRKIGRNNFRNFEILSFKTIKVKTKWKKSKK